MSDYIYLLQTRLTPAQQTTLQHIREIARARSMTLFLVGGAVRDLTSGSPIRDLDVVVQGNATKLRKDLEKAGGTVIGENDPGQALHVWFSGGVRLEVGSTLSATFPKPGKPVYKPGTIQDDLRRRDFTANAMALSLNDGSFGLLIDPLNGVADIENRELRLVSNYGFIEDPSRMIRAARLSARLGWHMEEKTQQRYETGKTEGYISALNPAQRGYETEEIIHEEDPLRVMRRLEAEGWSKHLFPAWTAAKANEAELERLRDTAGQLQTMGIFADPGVAYFPLLTAKLSPKEVSALKATFARPGFNDQIAALDNDTKAFAAQLGGKTAATPSQAWKMLYAAVPETVLWLAHTSKSAPIQAKFKAFTTEWAQARQRIPYQLMQEMRITPELPGYADLLDELFYAIMDGKLETVEATRAFLEPHSPPAPPPPVNLRRRPVKRETKPAKSRSKKAVAEALEAVLANGDSAGTRGEDVPVPVVAAKQGAAQAAKSATKPDAKPSAAAKAPANAVPGKPPAGIKGGAAAKVHAKAPAKAPAKSVAKSAPAAKSKKALPVKKAVAKPAAKKLPAKKVSAKASKPAKKAGPVKAAKKAVSKKTVAKAAPKKQVATKKQAASKTKQAAKSGKRR